MNDSVMNSGSRPLSSTGLEGPWADPALVAEHPIISPVRLVVESSLATSAEQPVTVGIPFPRGAITGLERLSLADPSGHPVLVQATPLAHWADGSVKWLLLDFLCRPVPGGRGAWSLSLRGGELLGARQPEARLHVEETARGMIVGTGPATFALDREVLAPILRAEIDGIPILDPARTRIVLVDARGSDRGLRVDQIGIEANGPVRATVRLTGVCEGRRRGVCRVVARLSFFAGTSLARIELALHNPGRAHHPGGLWDLGDPGSILFRDLCLRLGLVGEGLRHVQWTEDFAGPRRTIGASPFQIYQDSSGGENWRSRNHVNRVGEVPLQFRGYRVKSGEGESAGLRASPVVSVQGPVGTITAAIPEFWQQFPKAIDTEGGALNLRLFPGQSGDLFELQGGERKTHTVWLHFSRGDQSEVNPLEWVHRPARVHLRPEWYAEAGMFPLLAPGRRDPGDRYESFLSAVVDGPRSLAERREIIDEYGWRHYGDIYADHEGVYHQGPAPAISHYNNQYDFLNGLLMQYFRSGDSRWLDLTDPLARHVMDIDIYHTNEDRAAYNGGMFWHTDHYRDAATSTHRAYSRANSGPARGGYGGGPCNEQNYTTGLLNYYYFTGNPLAREAVLSLADWVVAMDDGRNTPFGLIDDGPTGLASRTTEANYHGPGRGCGNSINALLDAWLLTGSRDYLDQAERLIRRAVHPELDIPALDLLETELRWSYTVFLSVLGRYLVLKDQADERDAMYAYARSGLLAFAGWMVDHEIPYFDRPENLEYPTETWAAQELRKANVLRMAAQYADEPHRQRLIDRGNELAERAWHDLLRFPSRDVARSIALLLAEGPRDDYWRRHPIASIPAPAEKYEFGSPEAFVPQKRRVMNQLKTPRGAIKAVGKLASPGNWRRFLSHRRRSNH